MFDRIDRLELAAGDVWSAMIAIEWLLSARTDFDVEDAKESVMFWLEGAESWLGRLGSAESAHRQMRMAA